MNEYEQLKPIYDRFCRLGKFYAILSAILFLWYTGDGTKNMVLLAGSVMGVALVMATLDAILTIAHWLRLPQRNTLLAFVRVFALIIACGSALILLKSVFLLWQIQSLLDLQLAAMSLVAVGWFMLAYRLLDSIPEFIKHEISLDRWW